MEPARRPATLLFWTPLLLPIAVAVVKHTNLLSVWNEPSLNLLPVMMLAALVELIVVRLEEALGFDPFDVADDLKFPVTFGDFVRLYENHPK